MRSMLIRVLISWGLIVRHADDLETAVRAVLVWGPFDVVICDQELPDGNGLIFLRWLREQVITIPFLLISGRPPSTAPKPSARFDFLAKPFNLSQLLHALDRLLPDGLEAPQTEEVHSSAAR